MKFLHSIERMKYSRDFLESTYDPVTATNDNNKKKKKNNNNK